MAPRKRLPLPLRYRGSLEVADIWFESVAVIVDRGASLAHDAAVGSIIVDEASSRVLARHAGQPAMLSFDINVEMQVSLAAVAGQSFVVPRRPVLGPATTNGLLCPKIAQAVALAHRPKGRSGSRSLAVTLPAPSPMEEAVPGSPSAGFGVRPPRNGLLRQRIAQGLGAGHRSIGGFAAVGLCAMILVRRQLAGAHTHPTRKRRHAAHRPADRTPTTSPAQRLPTAGAPASYVCDHVTEIGQTLSVQTPGLSVCPVWSFHQRESV